MVPLHSYKMIATLQHTLAGDPDSPQRNPLLLRVDHNAGHGGGECIALLTLYLYPRPGLAWPRCSTSVLLQAPR